jgi:hypothetical protein
MVARSNVARSHDDLVTSSDAQLKVAHLTREATELRVTTSCKESNGVTAAIARMAAVIALIE